MKKGRHTAVLFHFKLILQMAKTFEKDGETYIVSEGVEELDTEALVDKSTLQKVMERVEKATLKTAQPSHEQESDNDKNPINIIFLLQDGENEPFGISGILEKYTFNTTATYEVLISVADFIKMPTHLESKNFLKVQNVSIFLKNQTEVRQETMFRHVKKFTGQKQSNSKWVHCSIEISTM